MTLKVACKLITKTLVLSLLLLGVTGCGSRTSPTVVRLMTWPLAYTDPVIDRVEVLFEREHPGYDLKVEKVPVKGYEEKLIVLMGAKDPPDVAILPQYRYPEYVRQKALSDITTKVNRDGALNPLTKKQKDTLKVKGKVLAVPSGLKNIVWVIPASAKHKTLAWGLLELLIAEGHSKFSSLPEPRLSIY